MKKDNLVGSKGEKDIRYSGAPEMMDEK